MAMGSSNVLLTLLASLVVYSYCNNEESHLLNKRVLPTNVNCDPDAGTCRRGDWVAEHIADCHYKRSLAHPVSCDATNDHLYSWVVEPAVGDRCVASLDGKRFACGASGTDTRCVCSDTNPAYSVLERSEILNTCQCQYWPQVDVRADMPAFCTGYYDGGDSNVHHWACCNNCNDTSHNTCDGKTWEGGSSGTYCGQCGQNTGSGREKYSFNCGSCEVQQMCSDRVASYDIPGFCWKWLDSFKGCCNQAMNNVQHHNDILKRQIITFCGDAKCTEGETPVSCPIDCCYQINSNCTRTGCTPHCCQAPSCCVTGLPNGAISELYGSTESHKRMYLSVVVVAALVVSLLFD